MEDNERYCKAQNRMNLMSARLDGLNRIFELPGSLVFIALGIVFISQGDYCGAKSCGSLSAIWFHELEFVAGRALYSFYGKLSCKC